MYKAACPLIASKMFEMHQFLFLAQYMRKILIFNINGLATKGMSHVPFQYLRISSSVFGKLILSGTASTPVILKTRLGCDFCHIRRFVTCFTIDKIQNIMVSCLLPYVEICLITLITPN